MVKFQSINLLNTPSVYAPIPDMVFICSIPTVVAFETSLDAIDFLDAIGIEHHYLGRWCC